MAAIMMMAAIGVWAVSTGRLSYVITHGISMNPVYYAGDLVIITKSDSYQVGQIAAYYGPGGKVKVLHRIIGGDGETGFVFKGDNNSSVDVDRPTSGQMIGQAAVHIPKVGAWIQLLLSPTGLGMLSFLFISGGAATVKSRRDVPRGHRKKKVKGMSGQGSSWAAATAVVKAVSRLHPALRVVAALSVVVAIFGLVLAVLGWTKPATQLTDSSSPTGESMTFSYSADVPRSAAYDGTTAYSPDPIYRNLAKFVVLRMQYLGQPGKADVSARLSSPTGWHSTMQLAQTREFFSERFTGTVSLDLEGMEKRAQEASDAIGADVGAVTVTVTARISHDDATFEPQVAFSLSNVQLALVGGADSLVADRSGTTYSGGTYPRQISVLGNELLTAAQARKYATILVLIALLAAAAVAVVAVRRVPLKTREQIERRYPHLLVPVEPMPSPPGKPVVIVDKFPALVKLAEKYGQMILTWTRPDGAEDFVVRDDGVTYRYRIEAPVVPSPSQPESKPAPARKPAPRKAAPPPPETPQESPPPPPETPPPPPDKPTAAQEPTATQEPAVEAKPEPTAEEPAAEKPEPAKPARAPRKKATPKAAPKAATPEEMPPKPPLKRPIRRKPEADREAIETLAELNKSVGGAPEGKSETPHEPIYDFLPHAKHAAADPDQADGVTGR
ncbi:signal peptidase I [Actinoplanes lutulentus]|uniref:signal peptidase I n=1 Tax=Actinoplanes lutulentus TaxID=1287878 RepID=UPI000DBA883B|nr:signal peptidase I [Actinoplanes lutulentus]MBB2945419.1 signal peptidase I [Actinoplanes lutulentus]